ncbi:MAG: hypothetical protein HZB18_15735 [Chloroflexi bacterium]|nr:hypothetical protein [Chloroflexota bacterium]
MDDKDKINTLLNALIFFRSQYLSASYSTMGFTIIAAGWLVTSRSARVFLNSHRWLGLSSIFMIILTYIGYWKLSLGVQAISQGIADKLSKFVDASGMYEHYIIMLSGVYGFILLQGLALVFVILVIIAALKDPGKE